MVGPEVVALMTTSSSSHFQIRVQMTIPRVTSHPFGDPKADGRSIDGEDNAEAQKTTTDTVIHACPALSPYRHPVAGSLLSVVQSAWHYVTGPSRPGTPITDDSDDIRWQRGFLNYLRSSSLQHFTGHHPLMPTRQHKPYKYGLHHHLLNRKWPEAKFSARKSH